MKKFSSALMAATVAASFALSAIVPVNAAPIIAPRADADNGIVKVQTRGIIEQWQQPGHHRQYRENREWNRPGIRPDRRARNGGYWNNGGYYYNGHQGYRHRRPGYRNYNGWWFPAGAFVAGAIIGNAIQAAPAPVYRGNTSAHVEWCYNRYRSYREYDNTFQPYNGPRQQCYSPYR